MTQETYQKLLHLLDSNNASYRLIDHEPEGQTEKISAIRGNEPWQAAKCIVVMVKLSKKQSKYVLAVVPGDKKVDLEAIKELFGGTYVSFANQDRAEELAGSVAGTVLPFSFHDDLELIVDPDLFKAEELYFNAARLDQSMVLNTEDYKRIVNPRLESIIEGSQKPKEAEESKPGEPDDLYKIRHSLAHVLAQAVLDIWPETKVTIGPPVDTGCYYDFMFKEPISSDDFKEIEKRMRKIINQGQTFAVDTLSTSDAVAFWKERNQPFKVELIEDLAKEGVTEVTHYKNVDNEGNERFVDLCKGGHVENLNQLPADGFKIMSLAGAYWRGDEKREQLSRVYVAAFASKAELQEYLTMLEEAKKRDHRKLGQELDLFTFSELVGPGLPLWTTRGTLVRNLLDDFVWELRSAKGYQKVTIPHITKKDLYETSGHWQKFSDELFKVQSREGHEFAMKPMNCPHHTQIFASRARSYRDLPQRYSETTTCYRDEQTGELHGLSRVRAFTQDDAHVFCRLNQVKEEFFRVWDIIDTFYTTVGFEQLQVRLSLHDPAEPEKYLGTKEMWEVAENSLREIAKERGVDYIEEPGEAAFYGPKVDFVTKDAIGREWQVATIQLDVNMPERFDLSCINEEGESERIVMIHAAIMGSLERFFSIYLEHIAGVLPLWLSPVQVHLLPVAEPHVQYAEEIKQMLEHDGVRVVIQDPNESLGKRVRTAGKAKIPYALVLGDNEVKEREVTMRTYGSEEQATLGFTDFEEKLLTKIKERGLGFEL